MNNNYYDDDDEELTRPKKKNSSLFLTTCIGFCVIALAGGAYFIFFSPHFSFINEPIIQRPHQPKQESTTSPFENNASSHFTINNTATNNLPHDNTTIEEEVKEKSTIENKAELSSQDVSNTNPEQANMTTLSIPNNEATLNEATHMAEQNNHKQNTSEQNHTEKNLQEPAFPFEDYSNENQLNQTNNNIPSSNQSATTNTKTSSNANDLAVHSMLTNSQQQNTQNKQQATQQNKQNEAQIRANTREHNANTNTFELAPPTNNTQNYYIASDYELTQKRQATEQSRLEQLQQAKSEQIALTDEQVQSLPTTNTMSLSETSASQLPNDDPTITNLFLNSMAQMLVNNYNASQNNVATSTVSASKLSQYFGTTLRGLAHPKGRAGIFEYAYQPQMITKITDYMAPRLLNEMNRVAKQKGLSPAEEAKMYHTYGAHVADTANILNAVSKTTNIKNLLRQTLEKEKRLLDKKYDFAQTQIEFENAKLERKNTEQLERKMQSIAKEASIIEQEYLTSKRLVIGSVFKEFPDIQKVAMNAQAKQDEIYELALWVYRRNNSSADKAAITALNKFANTLKAQ